MIRYSIIFILVFVICLEAQDPILIRQTSFRNATLAIPRNKMVIDKDDINKIWFVAATDDRENLFFTTDGGKTWSSFETYSMDYHSQIRMDHKKNLHITAPGNQGQMYFRIDAPANSGSYVNTSVTMNDGTNTNRFRGCILVNSDTVWVFTRLTGSSSHNVRFHGSADLGESWDNFEGSTGFIPTGVDEVRVGSIMWNGKVTLIVYIYGEEFRYYQRINSKFVTFRDSVMAIRPAEKIFTFNTYNSGKELHLVYQPVINSSNLVHVWKEFDGGEFSWKSQVIDIGGTVDRCSPYLVRGHKKLFLFYTSSDGQIYMREWDGNMWSQPSRITDVSGENLYTNSVEEIPDNCPFIPLIWTNSGRIYFQKIILGVNAIQDSNDAQEPKHFKVFPNPFNSIVNVQLDIDKKSLVQIDLYNISGQKIKNVIQKEFPPGNYNLNLNMADENVRLSSGIYILKIKTNGKLTNKKIIYLK